MKQRSKSSFLKAELMEKRRAPPPQLPAGRAHNPKGAGNGGHGTPGCCSPSSELLCILQSRASALAQPPRSRRKPQPAQRRRLTAPCSGMRAGCAPASPARLPGAGGLSCSQRGKTQSIPTRESSAPRRPAHLGGSGQAQLRAGAGAQLGAAACKLPPQENRSQGSAVHSRELPHRDGKSARVGLHVPRAAGAPRCAVGQTCCSAYGAPGCLVKPPSFFK